MAFRPAVITPYFQEDDETLLRCHRSVLAQTVGARHFLVADGHPKDSVRGWDVEHITLPKAHGDYGNAARAIGALSAINLGFNPILFLDADNWVTPRHIAKALEAKTVTTDIVALARTIVLDGVEIGRDPSDTHHAHVDTSCYAIFESAFVLIPFWATMTKPLSAVGDYFIFKAIRKLRLSLTWVDDEPTVFYTSRFRGHYKLAGKEPPPDAKVLSESELDGFSNEQLFNWSRMHIDERKFKARSSLEIL